MEKKKSFLINIAYWGIIIGIAYIAFKLLFPIILPFLIGFGVAALVNWISAKIKCDKILPVRIGLTVIIYGVVGTLIGVGVLKAFSSIYDFVLSLPTVFENEVRPVIDAVYNNITAVINELDPDMLSVVETIKTSLYDSLKSLLGSVFGRVASYVTNIVSSVPNFFISTVIMIVSTFYFVVDYNKIITLFQNKAPQKIKTVAGEIKYYLCNTLLVVVRSYAIIMLLTFTELSLMFWIAGIKHPFLIAGIIAIFDILPILGTGGIMIPWSVIALISGDFILGIKLIVIYVIVTVVRNYLEPRIVGVQLGLHPIVTLISMFIGLRLFGFFGLFGLPIVISYLLKRQKSKLDLKNVSKSE